ncbi:autophagy protein [Lichtheimia corymbifera JMRC:FSU:9682]|uniref:Autophagy-related protein 13 n=1 Tax=Lichtheimia corymbifera JMRC:FSU:9682 TaxID=1263082 RepID=A0A068RQN6_9FUNG|nr:autophagy protein [Lichtheimia corymbifera JMRC:FSU:9682]
MTFPGTPPASYPSGATQPNPRSYSSSPIAPVGPSTSSSSGTRNNKLDHIIQNFYTKTVQVIVQARVSPDSDRHGKCSSTSSTTSASSSSKNKMNKWFNIATQDAEFLREDLKYWRTRAIQSMDREPPPLILDIYLDTSDLTPNHSLMLAIDRARFNKVDLPYSTNRILLERWTLSLNHPLPDFPVDLPNLYKRSIIFFRALYSFVRLLPGHELHRRLSKYGQQLNELSLGHRLSSTIITDKSELSLDKSILDGNVRDTQMYEFSDVVTPLGIFKLQVQYRKNCDFRVEDSERDLSARMMDLHEQFFTPTMDKHRQEQRPRSAVFYDEQEEASQRAVHRFSSSFAPRPSSAAAATTCDSREQRQRRTSIGLRGSPTGSLKDTILSRAAQHQQQQQQPSPIDTSTHAPITIGSPLSKRLSAPHTSPFKTPSLSSSPQAEIMFSKSGEGMIGRPQASLSDRVRSTTTMADAGSSGSMRSRIEFSPSFDKLREHTRSPSRTDLTRRWSRTSDHSSINLVRYG